MLEAFVQSFATRARLDRRLVLFFADCGPAAIVDLAEELPDQVVNTGVGEIALVSAAAGAAACGHKAVAVGLASFLLPRAYEHVRHDVCVPRLPVKLVGIGAGLAFSRMGASHHGTEDVGLARLLRPLVIAAPRDANSASAATAAMLTDDQPWYLRLAARNSGAEDVGAPSSFLPMRRLRAGEEILLVSAGPILAGVLAAAETLEGRGIAAGVLEIAQIAPLDGQQLAAEVARVQRIVVVEDHVEAAGLGAAVRDALASVVAARITQLGLIEVEDVHGSLPELLDHYRLSASAIAARVEALLASHA